MRSRVILGQALCIVGIVLLLAFVPITPRVTGLPKHRIVEALLFWTSFGLLIVGGGQALGAASHDPDARRRAILAAVGAAIAMFICVVALTNLLYSSLQGVGLRPPGMYSGRLYPRAFGYGLFVPLGLALGCQLPLLGLKRFASPPVFPTRRRVARQIFLVLLIALLFLFGGACLLFVLNRSFAALAIGVTWFASLVVSAIAMEQILHISSSE